MAPKYASISAWLPFEVDFLDAFIPSDWIISYSTKSIEIEKISFLQSSILISLTSIAIHSTNKTRFEAECDIRKKIYSNKCLKIFISKKLYE